MFYKLNNNRTVLFCYAFKCKAKLRCFKIQKNVVKHIIKKEPFPFLRERFIFLFSLLFQYSLK